MAITGFSCSVKSPTALPKEINTDEITGLISINNDNGHASMEYELDGTNGTPIVFKTCDDVKQTLETNVVTHEYHLWRLMQINCKAISEFHHANSSNKTYWPADFNTSFIEQLPASAIPDLGGNSFDGKKGLLKDTKPALKFETINSHSIKATFDDDLTVVYVLIARGDFNHDHIEDILLRLDWHIENAFGKGFSLMLISKPTASGKPEIVWRDG